MRQKGAVRRRFSRMHLGRHFVHQIGEFALMLGDERIFDAGGDVAPRLAHTVAHLVEEGAAVDVGPAREAEEFFLAAQDKALAAPWLRCQRIYISSRLMSSRLMRRSSAPRNMPERTDRTVSSVARMISCRKVRKKS